MPGVAAAAVVDWPYPYGVPDGRRWDSDYCQYGVLEHARHRFLAEAQAVVNSDIDEFPVTVGGQALFDIVLHSGTGYLNYGGQWVEERIAVARRRNRRPPPQTLHLSFDFPNIRQQRRSLDAQMDHRSGPLPPERTVAGA